MSYKSNIDKVINDVSDKIGHIPLSEITIQVADYLKASNIERIHEEGKAVNGSNIGRYDTTRELYINPKKAVRNIGQPKGKNGQTKFKNGKPHKTVYNRNYKDYRNKAGRRIDKVDLNLTGKLQSEFNFVAVKNKADLGFTTEYGGTISEALEDKYNKKIWGVSKEDERQIKNIVVEAIVNKLNE